MKLFPVHSILWSTFVFLWASQRETSASSPGVCQDEKLPNDLLYESSAGDDYIEGDAVIDNYLCLLYPTNILNCSWSFHTLQQDTQLFVHISICDNNSTTHSLNFSGERVGSRSLMLSEHEMLYVILQFNVTLHDEWTVYKYTYDMDMLEVLSPPHNISASVRDGDLLVTWALPYSRVNVKPSCFEYQLDMGDQEIPKEISEGLSYKEPNADPSHAYKVRMRTRISERCQVNPQWSEWSEWSHAVMVDQSIYELSTLVIISISLGIPMILLAVLLFLRYQRVSELLFPPIPHPPQKYIYFLEKNETFSVFYPAPSDEPVEEITEVQEQNQGKTL